MWMDAALMLLSERRMWGSRRSGEGLLWARRGAWLLVQVEFKPRDE